MARLWSPQLCNDPEAFVLFAYPWGEKGTPLDHKKGPRRWQRKVLREIREHLELGNITGAWKVFQKAVASGRGVGKSALVAWLIHWFITTRIGGSAIVSANTENQLSKVTWGELAKWTTLLINSHWWEISATALKPATWLTELVERDLKKGTRYWGTEGKLWSEENPDGYAGPHNHDGMLVIFDEASGIPKSIWSVAEGYFTEPIQSRFWLAFSNPRRNDGAFFECFHVAQDFWSTDQIDARTVEDTDRAQYEKIIAQHGADSYEAKVEVYGEFPSEGDDEFIPHHLVNGAMAREIIDDPTAPKILGVDPARGGSDYMTIWLRQGRKARRIERIQGADTMENVGHIIDAIVAHNPALVCIDEGGLGAGIVDRLKEQKYRQVRGVNFGWKAKNRRAYANKRAEIWGDMKEWLSSGSLENDKRVKADLTGPKRKPTSDGSIQLESKKDMKARGLPSPDDGDALALTFAFPVAHREDRGGVDKRPRDAQTSRGAGAAATGWMAH